MARTYGAILGLVAFTTCLVRGLLHGGGTQSTLLQAWVGLLAFAVAGWLAGRIAEKTLEESVRSRLIEQIRAERNRSDSTQPGQPSAA